MARWGFWDWVAYSLLFVGAVILAVDQGLKGAPSIWETLPSIFRNSFWAFAPLTLLVLATLILIGRDLGWIGTREKNQKNEWVDESARIIVGGKKFMNERVLLDDHAYRNCVFENVTFVFNGTRPFEMTNCRILGRIGLASDNPVVNASTIWLHGLGVLTDKIEITMPPGMVVEPLRRKPSESSNAQPSKL